MLTLPKKGGGGISFRQALLSTLKKKKGSCLNATCFVEEDGGVIFFPFCRSEDTKPNLFTCGFDRMTLGWSIQPRELGGGGPGIGGAGAEVVSATGGLAGGTGAQREDKLSLSLKSAKEFGVLKEQSAVSAGPPGLRVTEMRESGAEGGKELGGK